MIDFLELKKRWLWFYGNKWSYQKERMKIAGRQEQEYLLFQVTVRTPQYTLPWVPYIAGAYPIEQINLRSVFPDEIILDCDNVDPSDVRKKLISQGFGYSCYSQHEDVLKKNHFQLWFPELLKYDYRERQTIKKNFIALFGADIKLAEPRRMVSLEWSPHHKSGVYKKLIEVCGIWYDNKFPENFIDKALIGTKDAADIQPHEPSIYSQNVKIKEPDCIKNMLEGVPAGKRSPARVALVFYYRHVAGMDFSKTIQSVLEWNRRCDPPDSEQEVLASVKTCWERDYCVGCDYVRQLGFSCGGCNE
jgi:hypothetical protein